MFSNYRGLPLLAHPRGYRSRVNEWDAEAAGRDIGWKSGKWHEYKRARTAQVASKGPHQGVRHQDSGEGKQAGEKAISRTATFD